MSKFGRNASCPCGSGKKYKKCCWEKDQKEAFLQLAVQNSGVLFESEVDVLSNRALELTNKGEFDEAERICADLIRKYPDQVDGLMRLAALNEKRRNFTVAADYYRQTAQFMGAHPDFDSESAAEVLECARRMERMSLEK